MPTWLRTFVQYPDPGARHTMEGVLGEPAYGGNRGVVGRDLVGFPGHQFGSEDAYINKPVDIEPIGALAYRTSDHIKRSRELFA